jgi:isopentenyl-diphosphate delta-isomerase type 2
MLSHPETRPHFELKKLAGDTAFLANIGAAQLSEFSAAVIIEAVKSIEADGLFIHLNPAQELFQSGGERRFRGWYESIARLTEKAPFPVLVKETGAGISPIEGLKLLNLGISHLDIAGSGGTDWVAVEALGRNPDGMQTEFSFRNWGYPSAELLLAYRQIVRAGGESGTLVSGKIIASGGLRSPGDFALSLACGAHLAAAALPFIRLASESGFEGVSRYIENLEEGIRAAMILSGSGSLEDFRKSELRIEAEMADSAEQLAEEALRTMES